MSTLETRSAFEFYQSIAHRLPAVDPAVEETRAAAGGAPDLLSIADNFDVFVFDAFGVLNVGDEAIPGAVECVKRLRAMNKAVFVLTNGAGQALSATAQKFEQLGFDFSAQEIVSSRHAAEQAMVSHNVNRGEQTLWGAITGGVSQLIDLPVNAVEVDTDKQDYDQVDAFIFLSSSGWCMNRQALLLASLLDNPRPLIVANPDVVAPLESAFSLQPGYFAHTVLTQCEKSGVYIEMDFHGKPFASVYQLMRQRIAAGVPAHRIAMLGDTLHTDVLGARVQGWSSILVSDHGLFRGFDVQPFIKKSGLMPDWIIPTI